MAADSKQISGETRFFQGSTLASEVITFASGNPTDIARYLDIAPPENGATYNQCEADVTLDIFANRLPD